jgi:hypothetical protein
MKNENKVATFRNPETGELWKLPRRYVPEHFERVDENEAKVRDE